MHCGVDEAGRGSVMGPLVVGVVSVESDELHLFRNADSVFHGLRHCRQRDVIVVGENGIRQCPASQQELHCLAGFVRRGYAVDQELVPERDSFSAEQFSDDGCPSRIQGVGDERVISASLALQNLKQTFISILHVGKTAEGIIVARLLPADSGIKPDTGSSAIELIFLVPEDEIRLLLPQQHPERVRGCQTPECSRSIPFRSPEQIFFRQRKIEDFCFPDPIEFLQHVIFKAVPETAQTRTRSQEAHPVESLFQHPVCHLSEPVRIGNGFLGGIRLTHQFIRIPIPSSLRKIVVQEVSAFTAAEEAMARQRPGKLRCRKLRGRF